MNILYGNGFQMTAEETHQIRLFNSRLRQTIQLTLVKTRHNASRNMMEFCNALQETAPQIHIRHETEDSDAPPELRIHPGIRYRSVPLGPELGPFLKALSWMFIDPEVLPPQPGLTDQVFPAELKLYVAEQCRFCPAVVENLVPLALASPRVRLTVIDAGLFMEEAGRDHVQSVPTLMLDSHFRWTGTIRIRDVVDAMIHRDPSRLEADTLMNMITDGNAFLLSDMMIGNDMIFPALLELLVHPKWPVRLGAMVTMEAVAAEKPALAQTMVGPLWDQFDTADDTVKGDILYLVGKLDTGASIGRIQEILKQTAFYDNEVIEAAMEALEKQEAVAGCKGRAPISTGISG